MNTSLITILSSYFGQITPTKKEENSKPKTAETITSEEDRYIAYNDGKPIDDLSRERLEVLNKFRDNPQELIESIFGKDKLTNEEKERKLLILAEINPFAVMANYEHYKDLPNADKILFKAVNQSQKPSAHASSHQSAIQLYEQYKESKFAEEILSHAIRKNPEFALVFPKFYESSPNAELRFRQAVMRTAHNNPYMALREIEKYKDKKYANEAIKIAAKNAATMDPHCIILFQHLFKGKPYEKEIVQTAQRLIDLQGGYLSAIGIENKEKYLHDELNKINNSFLPALKELNNTHNLSIKPMGLVPGAFETNQDRGYEFVFINTFEEKDKTPIRIGITYDELTSAETKEDLIKLLYTKLSNEKSRMESQLRIWNKNCDFDLPKDKTAAMIVGVHLEKYNITSGMPKDKGQNDDTLRMIELYQKNYGAEIYSAHMQFPDDWESVEGVKEKIDSGELPKTSLATKEKILESFENNLKKAIDEGKENFLLQYMMHGSQIGTMAAADGMITPEDFAQVLEKEYNGNPLSEQIDITIMADSCFSGMQIEKMIAHLEKNKTSVKNLRIIASASRNTPGTMSLTAEQASLYSEKLNKDWNGAFFYYMSYYYELLETQKKNGVEVQHPIGTFEHAIRFADLMTTHDSIHGARPQSYHYQYLPKEHKKIGDYFSQREIISKGLNDKEVATG